MEKKAYWQYLKNSLEIDDFMLPPLVPRASLYNALADLCFFSNEESFLGNDEKALFEKMIGAMGLSLEKVGLYLSKSATDSSLPCKTRVVFADDPASRNMGQWQDLKGIKIFTTHSLKNLLANPALKKSAWEHLKTVRATLT